MRAAWLLGAALAACAAEPQPEAAAALEQVLAQHRQDVAASTAAPAPPVRSVASPRPAGRAATGAPGGAGQLIGATPETLRAMLGEPRLRREEGGAQVWHYQAPHCHLDVVLYAEGRVWRVAWAQARASGTERRSEAACLREIGTSSRALGEGSAA